VLVFVKVTEVVVVTFTKNSKMSASKLDMSLDDIIKLTNPGRGRGRGARGRGSLRARGGLSRGNRRGATAGFRGRGRSRIGVGFGRRGVGGVLRGGIQKRRGFRQTSFARVGIFLWLFRKSYQALAVKCSVISGCGT